MRDALRTIGQMAPHAYGERFEVAPGVFAMFSEAGHILGSASITLEVVNNGTTKRLVFSGDIGRTGLPIIRDPQPPAGADWVLMESTYGDRVNDLPEHNADELAKCINWTVKAGGNVIIPSFALERSQELLYYLNQLLDKNTIPHLMVFLDSPMAIQITEIFIQHPELMDTEIHQLLKRGKSPFDFAGLNLVRTSGQSKAINHIKGTIIVIAGSGMCTGGRIKHHLVANISRPDSAVLFVGYQAAGTLGREIVDGAGEVRIFGQYYPVRAKIAYLHGFSGHADQRQLLEWVERLRTPPKAVFVTHGEPEVSQTFAELLHQQTGWKTVVPAQGQVVTLD
jgi:metallo-beta-lactamase family protein